MILQETVQGTTQVTKSSFLRRVFKVDGTFSAISGVLFVVGAGPLAAFLGLNATWPLLVIGISLLLYGADLWYFATREQLNPAWVKVSIALDVAWIVASWLILLAGVPELTTAGKWAVAIVADAVMVVAILKYVGLRKMQKSA